MFVCLCPQAIWGQGSGLWLFFFNSGKTGMQDYMYLRDFFIMVFSVVNPSMPGA